MSHVNRVLVGANQALKEYFEQLLDGEREPPRRNGVEAVSVVPNAAPPVRLNDATEATSYYHFGVAGLTLAVPAGRVRHELALPEVITPPLAPKWRRVAETGDGPLIVVDTATLVLPPGKVEPGLELGPAAHHLVVLDDGDWALIAETAGSEEVIELGEVRWRSTAGRRLWLAGTVLSSRVALLDLDEIRRMVK